MTYPPSTLRTPESAALRASDAERERTADALRRHHLDGRIDTDELQDRLGRCYAARTAGELAALTADLPGDEPPRGRPGATGGRRARAPYAPLVALVAVLVLFALMLAHTGRPGPFPILAILLVVRVVRGPWRPRTRARHA